MNSTVSSEKPKSVSLQGVAEAVRATRAAGKKVLLVGGPAIVHTGSARHVASLIREGWVQPLFAGNALATHDIEQALYGTSLGVSMARGEPIEHGHEHHLRAINTIRRGGASPSGRDRHAHFGDHVRVRQKQASTWCWPGRSATTDRCPK